jgi:hypothetical protein
MGYFLGGSAPEPHSGDSHSQELERQAVTERDEPVCTPVCTNQASPPQTDPVAVLAAALLGLSPADRARLAAMLIGRQQEQAEEKP